MGKEIANVNRELERNIEENEGAGRVESDSSTGTTDAGTGRGRGRGRAGSAAESGTGEKETVVPQVVSVEPVISEEEKKKAERNAKRRARYAEQKAKPRKVNKQKQEPQLVSAEQINGLIISVSGIIASRPNCEQWLLTESEVEAITKPLLAIIADSEKVEMIANNSNQIALAIACISAFAPRLLVTVQKMKAEKEKKKNAREADEAKRNVEKLNKQHDRESANDAKGSGDVVPFYGLPIS